MTFLNAWMLRSFFLLFIFHTIFSLSYADIDKKYYPPINKELYHSSQHIFLEFIKSHLNPLSKKMYGFNWGRRGNNDTEYFITRALNNAKEHRKMTADILSNLEYKNSIAGKGFYISENMWSSVMYADKYNPVLMIAEIDAGINFLLTAYTHDHYFLENKFLTKHPEFKLKYSRTQISNILTHVLPEALVKYTFDWFVLRFSSKAFNVYPFSSKAIASNKEILDSVNMLFDNYGETKNNKIEHKFTDEVMSYLKGVLMKYQIDYNGKGLSKKSLFFIAESENDKIYQSFYKIFSKYDFMKNLSDTYQRSEWILLGCSIVGPNKSFLLNQLTKKQFKFKYPENLNKSTSLGSIVKSGDWPLNYELECERPEQKTLSHDLFVTLDGNYNYVKFNSMALYTESFYHEIMAKLKSEYSYMSGIFLEYLINKFSRSHIIQEKIGHVYYHIKRDFKFMLLN
jgi:hypothetical protein